MNIQKKNSIFYKQFMMYCFLCISIIDNVNADHLSDNDLYLWQIVSNETLSEARGGFIFSNGIEIDIGLQQNLNISSQNMDTVTQNNILNNLTNGSAINIPIASENVVIQNSLDNLALRYTTQIDIRVKNLDSFRNPAALIPQFQTQVEPTVYK